jgi:ABC-type transporter Mla maintaining outer membrane lipid asymmetry permease subunit MlaE
VVTILGCIAASLGALVAAEAAAGIHGESWAAAFFRNLDATDVRVVVAKACLSGYLVALTCYHLGLGPKRSGADVGDAVNRAIVVGMGMVLAVHAIFTLFVYA